MKKSAMIVIVVLAAALGVVVYAVYSMRRAAVMRGRAPSQTVSTVRTQIAATATLHDYINTNGDIEAVNSVSVYPDIGGKIVSTNVTLGSPVRRGDVIARVDPSEPGSNYALSPVLAPINGSIIKTPLKVGTKVTTSSTITTIGDIASLQITAKIPERYVASLRTGLKAEISLEAYPDAVFAATVTHVSPVLDVSARTKEIVLTFDENDSRINAGMFGKVKLYTRDYGGAVALPSDAVVTKGDKPYLYVVKDDDTVEQREITLGQSVDGVVQVLSGIKEGERVVIEGGQVLSNGAKVRDISNAARGEK
ncbi:efflux RND transporter periplasmic adaptor subunit [Treponema socranskii]|uniref:efflux RND transporter periplasmic adaptor subunit n=1 Tax=Treponema socranskii TaxID=53419 RepID=UPI0028E803B3|nr:efflux RND transporter periplasmic adaptor subunit [Treponema socranskii]